MRSYWVNDFPGGSLVKNLLVMQEMWVQSLGQEDPLGKEMVNHSSILAEEIPWTEETCWLQSMWLQRVGHGLATKQHTGLGWPSIPMTGILRRSGKDTGAHRGGDHVMMETVMG